MKKFDKKRFLFLACVFLIVFIYCVNQISDYDYWFHYACGEWVWQHKAIPNTSIWSWYGQENNLEWISHEWLFGLFIYGFTNLFGENALIIFCPAMLALSTALAINYGYKYWSRNPIILSVFTILVGWIMCEVCTPRPQLFMYLMFVLLLIILFNEYKHHTNKIWWIVPLTILWTNVHGGSYIMIFISFFLLIICQSFDIKLGRLETKKIDKKITKQRIIVFVVALASVVLNGHGYKMYLYPITNMADKVMINNIAEWAGLDLNNLSVAGISTLVLMAFFVIMLSATKRKVDLFKLMIAGMWIVLTLKSIRFMPVFALTMAFVMPEYFDNVKTFDIKHIETTLLITTITLFCIGGYKIADKYDNALSRENFPCDELIEVLRDLPDETHLYNEYNIGGYLVYSHVETFIDGRADIYSKYNMSDYIKLQNTKGKVEELIEEYDFEYMLVTNDSYMDYWLGEQNYYDKEIIYIDKDFTLYKISKTKAS